MQHSTTGMEKAISDQILPWLSHPAGSWQCAEGTGALYEAVSPLAVP